MKNLVVLFPVVSAFFADGNSPRDMENNWSPEMVFFGILVIFLASMLFILLRYDRPVTIESKDVRKKFKRLAKYLPGLEHTRVKIVRVYLGKANGLVPIFRPDKVREFERELIDEETFSAECLLLDTSVVYLYITQDGDMIDIILGDKQINTDCIFSFDPEKIIQEDGVEIPVFATP